MGLLATAEAVLVGLVLSGELALLLGGFLAYQHRVSLPVMLLVATVAAIDGNLLGYELGRRSGTGLRGSRFGRRIGEDRWHRAQEARRPRRAGDPRRPVRGVLRALLPTVAGMAACPTGPSLPTRSSAGSSGRRGSCCWGMWPTAPPSEADLAVQASLLLLLLLVLLGALAAAARFIARHPQRIQAAAARQLERPGMRALHRRCWTGPSRPSSSPTGRCGSPT
jgi:hypothetical protein